MATMEPKPAEARFLLRNVSWQFYETCLAEIGDRQVRLTYHRGSLEMMSPSEEHERFKRLLGRLIEILTEELNIPIRSAGSTTWRRAESEGGLEADECYYIQNEPLLRGRDGVDLAVDPPPDLAIEIEITKNAVDRMEVCADLGVREIWRYDGSVLSVHELGDDQVYQPRDRSLAFPFLPVGEVVRFLSKRNETDETTWVRSFRAWVRQTILPGGEPHSQ